MEKDYQIRVIIAGGGVVGLVLANALEVRDDV
jgi:2-polyprenyl-6-methoxyphenol hydroxylase-like FAD-dependent oxidoreductase